MMLTATTAMAQQAFKPRDHIRVRDFQGLTATGRFIAADSLSLAFETEGDHPYTIQRRDIRYVERRHTGTRKGMLTVGGITGVLSALISRGVATSYCSATDPCASQGARATVSGALIGGAVGGAVGALIGSRFISWERVVLR
jgi:hypothetical protein